MHKRSSGLTIFSLSLLLVLQLSAGEDPLLKAASRYVRGVEWRPASVVVADFTCSGHRQKALLGTSPTEFVVAVFIGGTAHRPEVLRYSAKVRDPASAVLEAENQDYDPMTELGYQLPGFKRTKSCKGLNLSDGERDSAHIYWNHLKRRFEDWVR